MHRRRGLHEDLRIRRAECEKRAAAAGWGPRPASHRERNPRDQAADCTAVPFDCRQG